MKNLAGVADCDAQIAGELALAGIEIVRCERTKTEVATTVTGRLGQFTFRRDWYYWSVTGPMPLDVAERLYEQTLPEGVPARLVVRAGGDCGCRPPKTWCMRLESGERNPFVDVYHIDTQAGLDLFAKIVRGLQ